MPFKGLLEMLNPPPPDSNSLFFFDGTEAVVADPHGELEAHDWIRGAFGAALPAHGLPALPAVVLQARRMRRRMRRRSGDCLVAAR